ncbi:MAG: glutamine--fructose-6-phosphate transaminase (isomerizing) [Oscillospiraceae bacterium]|nr:glutamine--fructose-6-phosphate transaminase (isomerizing) [Oscillospiraceae bacterium]
MCGIVGFIGERKAAPILFEGLERLEYRGYDSAGIAVLNKDVITTRKTTERIKMLREITENGQGIPGSLGIGHTRWATHGAPSERNAHPHVSNDGKFAVVHNGIIENYITLKEELIQKGFIFESETDTEVVVHLLANYYKGNLIEAVVKAAKRLEGSYALGIICAHEPDVLVAVRRLSPLILGVGIGESFIASDVTALISHTKTVMYLEDGEIAEIKKSGIRVFDKAGSPVEKSTTEINWNIDAAEKSGYDHFMMKEIMEQPRAVRATLEPRIKNGKIKLDDISITAADLKNVNRIIITACGSASYAGQVGRYVLEELLRIPVEVDLASELRYRNPIINEHTLLIVISQSGETADTIAALKEAKGRGARVLSLVNVVGSTIAKMSDDVLYTWAGPEIAVATTKGYSTQLALLYLFGVYAAELLGNRTGEECAEMITELQNLPEQIEQALILNDNIITLAQKYHKNQSIFFIGRNIDYAVSMEGSLKLKEISYIHSEAYAAGELKHGTISLIDNDRLVIALACYERLFDKLMSNIKEVKARGAKVLATAIVGNTKILTEADDVMYIPRTNPLFLASVEVIPLQLLAYYVARDNGCDIDKPRNLAKSVTVE